jgi:phosphoglycolate phosphatase-like HAD superfamily hydrolase
MRHVIWDWNGTLFDDLHIVVESVNAAIRPFGAVSIDATGYRDNYQRPLQRFYDELLGRPVDDAEWHAIDTTFHQAYRDRLDRADLHPTARPAIERMASNGGSQSVLSMWWHDELVPTVERLGLDGFMLRVDGNRLGAGDRKAAQLVQHLEELEAHGIDRRAVVMIGDTFDDGHAAHEGGIGCVLFAGGGSHHRHELEATGLPVADTLPEALDLAGVL